MTFFASIESQRCPGKPVCDSAEICSIAIFVNIHYTVSDRSKYFDRIFKVHGNIFSHQKGAENLVILSLYCPILFLIVTGLHIS